MITVDLDRLERLEKLEEIVFKHWLDALDSSNDDDFEEMPEDIDFCGNSEVSNDLDPLEDILPPCHSI